MGEIKPNCIEQKYSFQDLVNLDSLREMFEHFSLATGYAVGIVSYPDQNLLVCTGWKDICTKFHRVLPASETFCKMSNKELTTGLEKGEKLNISYCKNGLVDGATPIIIREVTLANLFIGQVFFAKPDISWFRNHAEKMGYDIDHYLDALQNIPIVNKEKFENMMKFVCDIATLLAEDGLKNLQFEEIVSKRTKELETARMQLIQAEKMAAIGQLSAGVAHEINNPIGFIISNLNTLQEYIDNLNIMLKKYEDVFSACKEKHVDETLPFLNEIDRIKKENSIDILLADLPNLIDESMVGMCRIESIVKNLSSFANTEDDIYVKINIHDCIQSALDILINKINGKTVIIKEYEQLPNIYCYVRLLSQMFFNLLNNAIQAIDENGKITIRTHMDGDTIVVEISDNGCGMTEDICKRIFEPFFTTKPVGKGTGLGLSLVYNIIQKHNGIILVTSNPGEGSTFTIRLPKGRLS